MSIGGRFFFKFSIFSFSGGGAKANQNEAKFK
jgi:hypothetical protein